MYKLVVPLICIALFCFSCKKENQGTANAFGTYILRLTDSPGEYEHVYVDIQDVSVHIAGTGWIDIGPQVPGIYDLLAYNNGLDTLLSQGTLPAGTISQIRIILGSNNSAVINGTTHALSVPSAQQSGVKINVNTAIAANGTTIQWIDFDAGKSISQLPNATYQLKPVLRAYNNSTNGRIKGFVLPGDASPYVKAFNTTDTLLAIPEANGFFQFSGLSTGTYQLDFIPGNSSYSPQSLYNNVISGSQITDIGVITLQ